MSDAAWIPGRNEGREKLGDEFDKLSLESKLSVSKSVIDKSVNALVVPIYHSSVYVIDSVAQYLSPNHGGSFFCRRCGNPSEETAEVMIRELEGGAATLTYNSGLAAMNAVMLTFLSAGDHLVCQRPIYSGTYSFINGTMLRFGVTVTWVDTDDEEEDFFEKVAQSIKLETKMIYVETPCSPTMSVIDLERLGQLGAKRNVLTVVDGTLASPYLQQPIAYGADIVLHGCTKYMSGILELIAGCVTTKTKVLWKKLKLQQLTTGSSISPFDASLLIRGLRTLPLRMIRCSETAMKVATFLDAHPNVMQVWYPGLTSHPGHAIAKKQMRHFSGMIAFDVGDLHSAMQVVEGVRLIVLAVSLGGTETQIIHPASMSHGQHLHHHSSGEHLHQSSGGHHHHSSNEHQHHHSNGVHDEQSAITDGLIRLSVGLEDATDLIADLNRALNSIRD